MTPTYTTTIKSGPARGDKVGVLFGPMSAPAWTPTYRGEAWGKWGHAVCPHVHDSPAAATRCARAIARRIREASHA